MSLSVDHTRAFRSQPRRMELIEAVLAGADVDEGGWIEWKSSLDLASAEGQFRIARAILSFSNRTIASAFRYAEGTAYLIVGASHSNELLGVNPMDDAALRPALARYLGSPSAMVDWDIHYEKVRGIDVLVITVEAPRAGLRPAPLQREFSGSQRGTIFVRDGARVRMADPSDLTALMDRFEAGINTSQPGFSVELDVSVGDVALLDFDGDDLERWVRQREALLHQEARMRRSSALIGGDITSMQESLPSYVERLREKLPDAALGGLARRERSTLKLTVVNPADETIGGAELRLELPEFFAAHDREFLVGAEVPQRRYMLPLARQNWAAHNVRPGEFETSGQGRVATFHLGDLRPGVPVECDEITLAVWRPFDAASAELGWSVTSTSRRGRAEGSFEVNVQREAPLGLRDLIEQP